MASHLEPTLKDDDCDGVYFSRIIVKGADLPVPGKKCNNAAGTWMGKPLVD